jgi:MoaA/NifB/PqqE/SkfB family radical SAM enzyme
MAERSATMLALDHWHIEPSSICTLKCPRCPRLEVPESLLNKSLTLDFFENQIGADTIGKIKKITFCGNDGDPVYCKQFLEICSWIKSINPNICLVIVTNGSYKKDEWWERLGNVLNSNDEIHWSLDGWDQASNEKYRVKCDWKSIINGIQSFTSVNSNTYLVWASIAFEFNELHLDKQKDLAKQLGFDLYQLTKSTKFGSKYPTAYGTEDTLEPKNKQLIASSHRFERVLTLLSQKSRPSESLKEVFYTRAKNLAKQSTHSGICLIGNKGVFVNSQGEFFPCCWTANRYEHNQTWHNLAQTKFNLYNYTFSEIISDPFWHSEFLQFDSLECTTKCTREKLSDIEHTTEW